MTKPILCASALTIALVVREYLKHLSSVARAVHGALDIGAYEF